jgi:uncharacterized protein (TIGR02996 family)
MDTLHALLAASHADPADDMARLALADWLEEEGRPGAGELLRLHVQLRTGLEGEEFARAEQRLRDLILEGERPLMPEVVNSLGMRLALIPPGRFVMGSPADEPDRYADEGPLHEVELTRPFYLGVFPVTQEEYRWVRGTNPSDFCATGELAEQVERQDTSRHAVENLSWESASAFCAALSALPAEVEAGRVYRLPTEAEWEYACRAGLSGVGPFHFGRALSSDLANFNGRQPYGGGRRGPFLQATTPVDAYPPNAWGLYDLHGNVSEWCADWFDEHYYQTSPRQDPPGPPQGDHRVLRGGSWHDAGQYCRAAFRYDRPADEERNEFGLRVLLEYRGR